ncbi:MAG: CBS domain-containing protein [Chloroflexi bacterium]|nr:CBS domain-containing protein [Chloroflexota bacterium]
MAFLSELLARDVRDNKNALIGKLRDVLIVLSNANGDKSDPYPRVVALAVDQRGAEEPLLIPWEGTEDLAGNKIILQKPAQSPYAFAGNEIWLSRDVMDKQVIDTNDHRLVRVNDLELGKVGTDYRLINIDIGGRGLLRRLGWEDFAEWFADRLNQNIPARMVAWNDLDFLPSGNLRVAVAREHLRELHPADIAEILEDVGPHVGAKLIQHLADDQVADTLEELEPEFQAQVLEKFSDARAADIVQAMEPDEAADLLNELDPQRAADIVEEMEPDKVAEVQELLPHQEDTAGGMMTTNFLTIPPGLTCAETVQQIRANPDARHAQVTYYAYVADADSRLIGVVSLSDLLFAEPQTPIDEIMHKRPRRVYLKTPRSEVLEKIAKYNFLAIPVVDSRGFLKGVVTADDALEQILPADLKVKLPRIFR